MVIMPEDTSSNSSFEVRTKNINNVTLFFIFADLLDFLIVLARVPFINKVYLLSR